MSTEPIKLIKSNFKLLGAKIALLIISLNLNKIMVEEKTTFNWPPLESNPEIFTSYM